MAEIVPFYATETEHKSVDTLPTDTVSLDDLIKAVPKYNEVVRGSLLLQWVVVNDVLTYHIYHKWRKATFDAAEITLRDDKDPDTQRKVAEEANSVIASWPWWSDFEEKLILALEEYFKGSAGKMGYYREVDSWSVSLEKRPLWSQAFIEGFADHLSAKLLAKVRD